ncbi:MAG: sugar phosphate nucleotidyltransferase [Pseudomonadota bacterium]|nr:sugar phosphate nucleotidyltransferase [Pseudomonadota bacterium]
MSAGFGKRLLPFTSIVPKPLLPCMGVPPLLLNIHQLRGYEVQDIAINTHHLADRIEAALPTELGVRIFHEPNLLGTVGFAQNIVDWAEDAHILVYNADVVSDIDFAALQATHFDANAYATLMLLPNPTPNQTCLYTDDQHIVGISLGKRTTAHNLPPAATLNPPPSDALNPPPSDALNPPPPKPPVPAHQRQQAFGYACAQIWSPAFLRDVRRYQCRELSDALQQALEHSKPLAYHIHTGLWHDLGTPSTILRAHNQLLKRLKSDPEYLGIAKLINAPMTITDTDIRIGSPYVDRNCQLQPPNYLLHPDISIAAGARLHNCLIWGKTRVTGRHANALLMGHRCLTSA